MKKFGLDFRQIVDAKKFNFLLRCQIFEASTEDSFTIPPVTTGQAMLAFHVDVRNWQKYYGNLDKRVDDFVKSLLVDLSEKLKDVGEASKIGDKNNIRVNSIFVPGILKKLTPELEPVYTVDVVRSNGDKECSWYLQKNLDAYEDLTNEFRTIKNKLASYDPREVRGEKLAKDLSLGEKRGINMQMKHLKLFEEFVFEGEKYHFTFNDERYTVRQDKEDKTKFGIKNDKGGWIVSARGNEFNPYTHNMKGHEMLDKIQRGIKHFTILQKIKEEDIRNSEWRDVLYYCLKHKHLIHVKYVVQKLHCGKANAKYWIEDRERSKKHDDEG